MSYYSAQFIPRVMSVKPTSQGDETMSVAGQPSYQIAGLDLSSLWVDLVRQNKVSASMAMPPRKNSGEDGSEGQTTNIEVEYGIRMVETSKSGSDKSTEHAGTAFEEYVMQKGLGGSEPVSPDPFISSINATLAKNRGPAMRFERVGNFVSQLQLVRTLRPPPSEGFLDATTSTPPPYDAAIDSFVTGPLRLELRPLVGRLETGGNDGPPTTTPWDVFHNISPADRRGHFLVLPSLMDKERNWRGQKFLADDCHDMVRLAGAIEPAGSMFIGYNSVGAGASQNHIHCHSWPYPNFVTDSGEAFQYAVAGVSKIYDFYDIFDGVVEVSYLNYPVFCVQMSSCKEHLDLLGKAVAACVEAIGEAPHNIGFLNRISVIEGEDDEEEEDDDDESQHTGDVDAASQAQEQLEMVDVFLFARSKERSSLVPTLKLGISEMMGVFHAQSEEELEVLASVHTVAKEPDHHEHDEDIERDFFDVQRKSTMELALADVSIEKDEELWERIVENLAALEGSEA